MADREYTLAVIVCGGRRYRNRQLLRDTLDRLRSSCAGGPMLVIEGGAGVRDPKTNKPIAGANILAGEWADDMRAAGHDIDHERFDADWEREGKRAGPLRNYRQLARLQAVKAKRRGTVAFPGNTGTLHMKSITRSAGLKVMDAGALCPEAP